MTQRTLAALVSLCMIIAGFFTGCKTPPTPEPPLPLLPPPMAKKEIPSVQVEAQPAPPPASIYPLRPITREIIDLVHKSKYTIQDFQYYISSAITLERGKGMEYSIEINRGGDGFLQEINAQERIIIDKETGGVLIPDDSPDSAHNPQILRISFDEDDGRTLAFKENKADNRYYLLFREDLTYGEFTEFGTDSYKVSFNGEIPYLLIRLDERMNDQPSVRQFRGRYVVPTEFSAPPPPPPPASQPTTSQNRAGTGGSSAPDKSVQNKTVQERTVTPPPEPELPPPPQDDEDEEELDLDALLDL